MKDIIYNAISHMAQFGLVIQLLFILIWTVIFIMLIMIIYYIMKYLIMKFIKKRN